MNNRSLDMPTAERGSFAVVGLVLLLAMASVPAFAQRQTESQTSDGCVSCHLTLPDRFAAPARLVPDDVHGGRDFGCVSCHGGDGATSDQTRAKDPTRDYRGVPTGREVVDVCTRCHSDATLMRRFAPAQRVDQASEYAVSVHGQRLAEGDTQVPTCASCHGAHGVRAVTDVRSPVFPTKVAATCGRCHGDSAYMQSYDLAGTPFPTDQQREYETSVHHEALIDRNDLSAPTCNDCHGNHGAAPPGVDAVVNVCGTCHAVFAERFEPTTHAFVMERGCVECHGNHAIEPPSDELIGTGPDALCSECHTEGDAGLTVASHVRDGLERFKTALDETEALVARARNAGMEMGDAEVALRQARNQLTLARTEVHGFDAESVDAVLEQGHTTLAEVEAAGRTALDELSYRRRGLAVSLALILLFVVALYLKVRRLDRPARS